MKIKEIKIHITKKKACTIQIAAGFNENKHARSKFGLQARN